MRPITKSIQERIRTLFIWRSRHDPKAGFLQYPHHSHTHLPPYGCGSVYKRFHIRDCRVHGLGVTLPLHGRYKAVTLRSCNVDPCIRTRISRGFQNCAQIDLNQHARKTIRQKPQIALPSTCRVPASTLQNSWNLRDRWRCPNLLYTDPHPYTACTLYGRGAARVLSISVCVRVLSISINSV